MKEVLSISTYFSKGIEEGKNFHFNIECLLWRRTEEGQKEVKIKKVFVSTLKIILPKSCQKHIILAQF